MIADSHVNGRLLQWRCRAVGRRRRLIQFGAGLCVAILCSITPAMASAASVAGAPFDTGFPRLGNWSSDVDKESLEDLARYDYLVLYDGQKHVIPGLRALNPDIRLLTYTSAGEVGVNHPLLARISTKWMLQQGGTTLAATVSAGATSLPVVKTDVFRPGQLVVVDEEIVRVLKVVGGSIVVERGVGQYGRPATEHLAGRRIAALVQRFNSNIEMNLSTDCPKWTPDPDVQAPETWAMFAARLAEERCSQADWDGIVVDRVENSESFLVDENKPLSRSIDSKLTNKPVTDDYAAFDKAWVAGVRDFLTRTRVRLGSDKAIVGNNAAPHYELLNGSNLENFPRFDPAVLPTMLYKDSYTAYWNHGRSFYDRWALSGARPNYSTIMTYDYEPTPIGTESPRPAGKPDYQKMRFGLATALMSDGFFTYQLRVWGPREGLFWFDEYDNAGKGKHYLGQPISDQRLALAPLTTADLLGGSGSFGSSTAFNRWKLFKASGYSASVTRSSGAAVVNVLSAGPKPNAVGFYTGYFAVKSGSPYTVRFRARADKKTTVNVKVATRNAPWGEWLVFRGVALDTSWREYELSGNARGGDSDARIAFDVGGGKKKVWLDDVRVQSGSRLDVMRRDFEEGVALINGTYRPITVPLGASFRKISGVQVPSINNGAVVSTVILQPKDGLVLLRESDSPRVPTYLSASVSSTRPKYGASVVVSGALRHSTSTGSALGGRPVYLQSSTDGKQWNPVATLVTTADGRVSRTLQPHSRTYYRLRYWGQNRQYVASVSPAVSVLPAPTLSKPSAPATASSRTAIKVKGTLAPRHSAGTAPVRVYRYRLRKGKWRSYGYVKVKVTDSVAGSNYLTKLRLAYKGKWRVRAYHPADSRHQAAWSPYTFITVK